jgi:hypothetical protein
MARILVVYGTTDGHTARIAQSIADTLRTLGDDARSIHPFRDCVRMWIVAVAIVGFAHDAWSQTVAATEWHRGTTLAGFVGAASISTDTDAAAGAALGWELTPHFTLEGRGMWIDAGPGADAFAAVLGARIPLMPARPVVPFVSAGVGVYRATFDAAFNGIPRFYQRRMMSGAAEFRGRTFDDFAVAFGGGVDIVLARHLALRPDVTVLLVTTRSDSRAVPVYGVQLAYHFESHPITPAGRPTDGARGAR